MNSTEPWLIRIMDSTQSESYKNCRVIFEDLTLIHEKERELSNNLSVTFAELLFLINGYLQRHELILKNGHPGFDHFLKEAKDNNDCIPIVYEIIDTELSTYFKSSLVLSKSILDKLVALFEYRYNYTKKTFDSRGKHLKKYLETKYHGSNKNQIISLIEQNKIDWIDDLLQLRDDFTHFSELRQYSSFYIHVPQKISEVKSVKDFIEPQIVIGKNRYNAVNYLHFIYDSLLTFCSMFLKYTGFDNYYHIDMKYKCDKCSTKFFKLIDSSKNIGEPNQGLKIQLINKKYNHGKITCNKCGHNMEMTFKDLKKK